MLTTLLGLKPDGSTALHWASYRDDVGTANLLIRAGAKVNVATDLGVTPPDDRDGCLQDVHWYSGGIGGAFQSYTIGNILSAQFYRAAMKAHPEIPGEIARGEFGALHGWLRQHIYRHGRKFPPNELVKRATGEAMSMKPYLAYLRGKYGELYHLPQNHERPDHNP